ncbi:unnamed protein product [Ectocarpus sp. 12 AP-2014]
MPAWCFTPRKNRTEPLLSPRSTASPPPRDVASQEPGSCMPTFLKKSLSEYDALSIIEWDVLVASDDSFEELYYAAFRVNEEFWVKGSNLEGTSFPSSAEASEMWQVLGHINGNAIYNNDDPAFVEYVEYTRARWGYEHPYDVALWMTISDFPYSRPLYQRYSSKFVVTNLISYVGDEHVTQDTVSDAVAGKTLFVHGGGVADVKTVSAPPPPPVVAQETARRSQRRRKLQRRKMRGNRRRGNDGDGTPRCTDGCEYTSKNGTRGRVCDANCSRRDVYGTLGCGTKDGAYGTECRACYNDGDKAHKQDTPENRAIMCSTVMPVDVRGLWLSMDNEDYSLQIGKAMEAEDGEEVEGSFERVDVDGGTEGVISFFEEAAERPFFQDLKRGNLCAFVGGRVGEEAMWEVTVKSILQFMPGMRVAIAAGTKGLDAYDRSMGSRPGVTISSTQNPATASLFADRFCGAGTALILYVEPGSVLSRPFTSKDTHSPQGDLLVVHGGGQGSYHDDERSRRSGLVLGLEAPSFTRGTDLILPVGANKDLRESLGMEMHAHSVRRDGDGAAVMALTEPADFEEVSAVPQARNRMLAALAYARNTPGVWFGDPQVWVGQNLFQEASIWDIPLVKPRFTCAIALAPEPDCLRAATTLQNSLDFFFRGGKCKDGLIEYSR